ncbi:hypothetical protein [Catalinimonas niigatensis]|uniref:hypothetical protein n=1 Tax=Catalinimonas niigatensis TaxID=1397264 RepID=UPI0026666C13|nr:hypothetical protein [Catalinimonas niigatensis]WPP49748.1 hypothetical protein PZB72_24045 [Catalinimonas niigatensis]
MKAFKNLSRTQQILTVVVSLLVIGYYALNNDDANTSDMGGYPIYEESAYPASNNTDYSSSNQTTSNPMQSTSSTTTKSGSTQPIVVMDQGLQMPVGTYHIPQGWKLIQDIAVDPSTNQPVRDKLDIVGPKGELIRALGSSQYGGMTGIDFMQGLQRVLSRLELEQVQVGNMEQDPEAQQRLMRFSIYQRMINNGTQVQCMKAPVSGYRNGQHYEGVIQVTQVGAQMGALSAIGAIAPAGNTASLMKIKSEIDNSLEYNPAYEQRREQIQQAVLQRNAAFHNQQMANSSAAHQQRMADNQAAFDAHQGRMRDMSQLQDAQHKRYMSDPISSGSYNSSSSSGYGSHDAYIDGIHERSTFDDPWSGQQQNMDGQYDYNYTNGLGEYYRTNDPSFNPNSLQGDWQEITPLNPGY